MIASIVSAASLTAYEVMEAAFAWAAQSEYIDAADKGLKAYDVWTPYDAARNDPRPDQRLASAHDSDVA